MLTNVLTALSSEPKSVSPYSHASPFVLHITVFAFQMARELVFLRLPRNEHLDLQAKPECFISLTRKPVSQFSVFVLSFQKTW